ncbi:MAG: YggS family pyridoxal phosphate-dependent enzyme [Acidobacteria bacterium]|nr:YggS family pyridoxal phosphate-dependent enzyme [Acidobacteriota bacterium]MCA1611884.1 YggS family pyridoxal phosphate-dependent enzyme [Acidobacteriota bacterium]
MTSQGADEIHRRHAEILDRVARAAERCGRDPAGVALLAVTKTHPAVVVREAALAGLTRFGENRVAEGASKIGALRPEFPALVWKLIGPLQTNKARAALQWFSVVETLDRERLASRLEALLPPDAPPYPVLVEINIASEASKSGAGPSEAEALIAAVLERGRLDLRGLMAVPPFDENPEAARHHFRRLRKIRDGLADRFGRAFPELSMGMSHDFEVAIEEGATEIRLGTALFGDRSAT